MTTVRKLFDSQLMFITMLLWLVLWGSAQLWPASYWLDVATVQVLNARAGEPVPMLVDRSIKRGFHGEWTVTLKRKVGDGFVNMPSVTRRTQYEVGARLPDPVDLEWWTDDVYKSLPAGTYHMTTTWTVLSPLGVLADKRIRVDSNIFEVTP